METHHARHRGLQNTTAIKVIFKIKKNNYTNSQKIQVQCQDQLRMLGLEKKVDVLYIVHCDPSSTGLQRVRMEPAGSL